MCSNQLHTSFIFISAQPIFFLQAITINGGALYIYKIQSQHTYAHTHNYMRTHVRKHTNNFYSWAMGLYAYTDSINVYTHTHTVSWCILKLNAFICISYTFACVRLSLCLCVCVSRTEWVDFKKNYFLTVAHTRMACTERTKSAFESCGF